ncbi:TPA: topoisomerase DNA-binding C4 zinc finger domain-containing protein, partial [Enterococcus faecium]|nr:topoisomerase DNA-binding C4 zinc finger domain-containing protein [Enterococcus faecium]
YVYMEIEKNKKAQNIECYDRYGLLQLLNNLILKTMEKYIFLKSLPEKVVKCPKCESGFIVDKWSESNHSYFRACTMFPECKYKEKIISK